MKAGIRALNDALAAAPVVTLRSGGVVESMRPEQREIMEELRRQYEEGKLSHLTIKQLFLIAKETAEFPGALQSFSRFLKQNLPEVNGHVANS